MDRRRGLRRPSLRSLARHLALDVLSWSQRWQSDRWRTVPRVQLLTMHHLFADEADAFRRLLGQLQSRFEVIGYPEAITRIVECRIDKPYLAISFDDGMKCCLRAAEILSEFSISGCFFISPAMIGESNRAVVERFCRERLDLPPVEFMTWEDVQRLCQAGHEIGGHTMSHCNLAELSRIQAQQEICESFDVLAAQLGSVKHFSWPYGQPRHITSDLVEAVFETGYVSCASAQRGCHRNTGSIAPRNACVFRDNIEANWPIRHVDYFLRRNCRGDLLAWPRPWIAEEFEDRRAIAAVRPQHSADGGGRTRWMPHRFDLPSR